MFLTPDEAKRVKQERLIAVKRAYWNSTPVKSYEIWKLQTSLVLAEITDLGTVEQAEKLFMMLPKNIIGDAIKWGFNDHDVEKDLYGYLLDNKAAVQAALAGTLKEEPASVLLPAGIIVA